MGNHEGFPPGTADEALKSKPRVRILYDDDETRVGQEGTLMWVDLSDDYSHRVLFDDGGWGKYRDFEVAYPEKLPDRG